MNDRLQSAAGSIWPHLPHDKGTVQPHRQQPQLAAALYPSLTPKPVPPSDPFERHLHFMGLIRKDARQGRGR
jgi:hypothetical protein